MSSGSDRIVITNRGPLRIITFTHPKAKNALNHDAYNALRQALNDAAVDDSVVIVALTGDGDFYCSGNDLKAAMEREPNPEFSTQVITDLIKAFINFPKVLVAVVNGGAIGIAATTVALCDVVYAVDTAYFLAPFTNLGLSPEGSSSYTFPRILGKSKAMEMLLFNHKLTADEALRFNFVSELCTKSELDTKIWPKLEAYARELPPESLRASKALLMQSDRKLLLDVCDREGEVLKERMVSEDSFNAMLKFVSKKSKL